MKNFILTLLIAFAFLSCSKDDEESLNNNGNSDTSYKLVQIKEDDMNVDFGTVTNFTYENGVISKIEFSQNGTRFYDKTTNFNYVDDKLKSLSFFKQSSSRGKDTFNYTGNLVSSLYSTQNSTENTTNFKYNNLNELILSENYDRFDVLTRKIGFNYNNSGNILSYTELPLTTGASRVFLRLEYDDKINPMTLVYNEIIMKVMLESKNNITKMNDDYVYEYVYNEKGFPVQKILKVNGYPDTKTTYTYK